MDKRVPDMVSGFRGCARNGRGVERAAVRASAFLYFLVARIRALAPEQVTVQKKYDCREHFTKTLRLSR